MRYNRIYENNNFIVPTDYTQTLCNYAEAFNIENVPEAAVEKAKQILAHTIGAVYAAKDIPESEKIRKIGIEGNGGEGGKVTNWGTGEKLSAINASMVTGALADMLEWDDCTGTGHPSGAAATLAWMTAEETHKGGKDVLRAIVLSYDVAQRVAKAVFPGEIGKEKGFGMTSWQMFSSFIAAGSIYGFDSRGYDVGIGTVCENSTIPALYYKTTMSESGHYEFGFRNKDGLHCAKAVVKGLHNGRDALDEDKCYSSAISDTIRHEYFKKNLGTDYEILNSILRKYPADMWVQTVANIISRMKDEHKLTADNISTITIDPPVEELMAVPDEKYESIVHAQNNIPYVIACILTGIQPGAEWYKPEMLSNSDILNLAKKVKSGISQALTQADCYDRLAFEKELPEFSVTVVTADGNEYSCSCSCTGALESWDDISQQFVSQVSPTLGEAKAKEALNILMNIEKEDDIAKLAWIVGGK